MALVEKYHVIAVDCSVDPWVEEIEAGIFVSLNALGKVVKHSALAGHTIPYGVAGDTDNVDNKKIIVYHSGGEFATDQFSDDIAGSKLMTALYLNEGLLCTASTVENTASGIVAYLTKPVTAYPNGTYLEFKLVI